MTCVSEERLERERKTKKTKEKRNGKQRERKKKSDERGEEILGDRRGGVKEKQWDCQSE